MGQSSRRYLVSALLSGVALTAFPLTAAAAEADTATQVEELIVTAQKREQSLQDVPIAINVLTGSEIKKAALTTFMDIQQFAPGIVINNNGDSRVATINIRGVGSSQDAGKQSSIGIFVDGVFMSRIGQGIGDLLDIERIEVLRGPQGTLFGMNTAGGLIHIVTAQPNVDEYQGYAEVIAGNYNRLEARGSVTGPIIPGKLGFSLAAYSLQRDGIVYNATMQRDVDDQRKTGVRAKLRYVSDDFNYTVIADQAREDSECCAYLFFFLKPGANILGTPVAPLAPPGYPFSRTTVTGHQNTNQNHGGGVTGEGNWTIAGGNTITSVSAARNWKISADSDTDSLPLNITDGLFVHQEHKQFSQELRIASPADQKLEYVAGLFYFTRRALDDQYIGVVPLRAAGTDGRTVNHSNHKDTSKAAFVNLTYHVTDQLSLAAGARYTKENQKVFFSQISNNAAFRTLGTRNDKRNDDAVTYTLTGKYDLTPDVMTYLTFARGFKPGGFDLTRLPNFNRFQFEEEKNDNVEVGMKGAFLDRRVTLNAAIFHTKYKNFQTLAFDGLALVTTNAPEFTTKGFELEAVARPVEGLRLQGAYAYTDATYNDFPNAQCPSGATTPFCDLSGRPLSGSPKKSFTGSAEYRVPIGQTNWSAYARGEMFYRGRVYLSQSLDPNLVQGSFTIFHGRVGVVSNDGILLELWARNLTDKAFRQLGFPAPLITGGYAGFLNEPRMVGGRVSKTF